MRMEKAIFDAIKELSNKIDAMDVKFTARMDDMEARFTGRMDGFDAKLDKMDTKFTRKINALVEDVEGIKKSLEYIKTEQSALRFGLESLDATVTSRIDKLEEENEKDHQLFREALGIAN